MDKRLFVLDQDRGAVMSIHADGSGLAVLVDGCAHPDGIVGDSGSGYLYWTNMGATFDEANGSIERSRLDGSDRTTIVAAGATRTPKQLRLDTTHGKIYWCDREGMGIMRANLDGTCVETIVSTGDAELHRGDATRWCVGLALDLGRRQIYWTQKGPPGGGLGRIFRAQMDRLDGGDASTQTTIELLADNLPEPVDLELSDSGDHIYWTDRSRGPNGGSIHHARIGATGLLGNAGILAAGLDQPIGLALEPGGNRLFAADLGGNIHAGGKDGSRWHRLVSNAGRLTGICII